MIFKALTYNAPDDISQVLNNTRILQQEDIDENINSNFPWKVRLKKKKKTQLGFDLNAGEIMSMIPTANSNPIWIRIISNQYKQIKIIPLRASEVGINYKLAEG